MAQLLVNICLGTLLWIPVLALAGEDTYTLVIKDHQFSPSSFNVPAGQKVKLLINNQDPTPEEFESYELNREKVVSAGGKSIVFIGPLKPGTYKFFGDFHKDTAQGSITAQ